MKSAQTATVASSCIETSPKTLRRKPGQPKRSKVSLRDDEGSRFGPMGKP